MALKAGRVGVSPTEVDKNGRITGGGSSVTVVDNLSSTSSTDALSAKQGKVLKDLVDTKEDASKIGGFEFRTNEGTAQYRTSPTGEWLNFSSAGANDNIVVGTGNIGCIVMTWNATSIDKVECYSDSEMTEAHKIGECEVNSYFRVSGIDNNNYYFKFLKNNEVVTGKSFGSGSRIFASGNVMTKANTSVSDCYGYCMV